MLNLFLGILLEGFTNEEVERDSLDETNLELMDEDNSGDMVIINP